MKGNGLNKILSASNISIIGTEAMINVNHIKQARYCMQVSLCANIVRGWKFLSLKQKGGLENYS